MENKISSRIKELRTSLGLTQSAFAESIGTSQNALSGYENGDRIPSYDILISIATKYNVSLDWLCGLSEKTSPANVVSTYADIISILTAIADNSSLNIEIGYDCPDKWHGPFDNSPEYGAIRFNDSKVTAFLHEWQDMLRLLKNGTIKESLYKLWLKDQIDKYNEPITSTNHIWDEGSLYIPDSIIDDDLPFT